MKTPRLRLSALATLVVTIVGTPPAVAAPHYEPAFANGRTVLISVKDPMPGKVARQAQHAYFEVIYPIGWEYLTSSVPQCNPCDHAGDEDDFTDYHDHVFAAEPSSGKGNYGPLWRLNLVVPAYNGDAAHDLAVSQAYAAFLPIKSGEGVLNLLAQTMPDGTPLAERIDVDYVFLAAIVNANAEH